MYLLLLLTFFSIPLVSMYGAGGWVDDAPLDDLTVATMGNLGSPSVLCASEHLPPT